jgi:hypothetical protein
MLSLTTARQLKEAGLPWAPAEHDFFFIPFQSLDEKPYVISDISILVERMGGDEAITFNGTAEWALDYLVITEAIWAPSESQLRDLLEKRLVERGETQPCLVLSATHDGYMCEIQFSGTSQRFEAFGASEAYADALLHVLKNG